MPAITVRNLPERTHRALKVRAAKHGRSAEAEVRAILEDALYPEKRPKFGSELAAFGKRFGGVSLEVTREVRATDAATFE